MIKLPIIVKLILALLVFACGAFCIYGLTGMDFKDEKPSKARQIAALLCYVVIIGFFGYIIRTIATL